MDRVLNEQVRWRAGIEKGVSEQSGSESIQMVWCSGGYHLERGGMPLYDAVRINCKKGATTENEDAGDKYMG